MTCNEQIEERKRQLRSLIDIGAVRPVALDCRPSAEVILARFGDRTHEQLQELQNEERYVALLGCIFAVRSFGKANYWMLSNGSAKLQVYIREDPVSALSFQVFKLLTFGDWAGVEGRIFRTRTHELAIWASELHFLAKCLIPPADSDVVALKEPSSVGTARATAPHPVITGLLPCLQARSGVAGHRFRCGNCQWVKSPATMTVWVPDGVYVGSPADYIVASCRQTMWNGESSLWCLRCALELSGLPRRGFGTETLADLWLTFQSACRSLLVRIGLRIP